jgi:hypothetical protein
MAMPSETAIAVNSLGVHPASFTPRLALCASRPRWMLQGVASLQVEDTPTRGRSKSSSVSPIALYIARCGALSGPSSAFLLSSFIVIIDTSAYFKIFQLLKSRRYLDSVNSFYLKNGLAHSAFCITA